MRIPGPQTQGQPQTIMEPSHQVLSSGGVHPLPHTDLTVRTLPDVRGTSGHLPDRSTGAPARLHDHLPPRPAPLTGTPNGGLPNKPPPPGHDGKSGFPREISLTGSHNLHCVSKLKYMYHLRAGLSECTKRRINLSECTSHLMAAVLL